MSTIALRDVCVKYAEAQPERKGGLFRRPSATESDPSRHFILNDISLEIRHGETIGILGPSGCGKTTLLRAVAGLIPITSGEITYDGQDMRDISPGERGI